MSRPKRDLIDKRIPLYISPEQEKMRQENLKKLHDEYDLTQSEVLRVFLSEYLCNEKMLNCMGFLKKVDHFNG